MRFRRCWVKFALPLAGLVAVTGVLADMGVGDHSPS